MTDITPYLNRLDILNETAQQIVKDFGMLGMEIQFSGNANTAYTELFLQIYPIITVLLKNKNKMYNLLYRIDISEKQIKNAFESSGRPFSETLTELIMKRELQKVVTRKIYSQK